MSRYTIVVCAIVGFASATSAGATTIGVSSFSPQFVGVDLAKATILSDADSASVNTSVAFIERIDLMAPGVGFTTNPPSGSLETHFADYQPVSSVDRRPSRDQRQLLFGRGCDAVARRPDRVGGRQRDSRGASDFWLG